MKVSRNWLQSFFDETLPSAERLAEALTFHVFEIESVEERDGDAVLDVKVTPNRGHDCLSHRGIAKELSVILDIPLSRDPLAAHPPLTPDSNILSVTIENRELCPAYAAAMMKDILVGPSPQWLRERLESIGQRSINNVVDATNYVMLETGQPLHAFDIGTLADRDGMYEIAVRSARAGEPFVALDGKEYQLSPEHLCIVDAVADVPIGLAGIKGGKGAEITEDTRDIIIESANFNAAAIRKTARAFQLRTDASVRFEHGLSPTLTVYGLTIVVQLIAEIAGGTLEGYADIFSKPQDRKVTFFADDVNSVLGTNLMVGEIERILERFCFSYEREGGRFTLNPPFERLDLNSKEDLIEEVGRITGFDKIPAAPLPVCSREPEVSEQFHRSEQIRRKLIGGEYSEIITSVFADKGERQVMNKIDSVKPYLRATLLENLTEALEKNRRMKDLLELQEIKLFEIGTVWKKGAETSMVGTISEKEKPIEIPLEEWQGPMSEPASHEESFPSPAMHYGPFSRYPYVVRDIAVWVPAEAVEEEVYELLKKEAGTLLLKSRRFDRFEKEGKVSLAFRLIFQSFERTLTDKEVNTAVEKITAALEKKNWVVR